MEIKYLEEPKLQFGIGESVCPKEGISNFHPYDFNTVVRPEKIVTGVIGKGDSVDLVLEWLKKNKSFTAGKESKNPKPNLFPSFDGLNSDSSFKSEIAYDDTYIRKINNSLFEEALEDQGSLEVRIENMVELYLSEIRFLAKNKNPNVIICVVSEKFMDDITEATLGKLPSEEDENPENEEIKSENEREGQDEKEREDKEHERNFRRLLKARAMQYNIPIQIMRDRTTKSGSSMQDQATIAWNLFTAIYYKAGGIPWALKRNQDFDTCFAGISFYRSLDKKTIQTSVAQIFNERGKGVILRGDPIEMKKGDRVPHLTEDQAFDLLEQSLNEYKDAIKIFPRRLVIHKTSNFSSGEIAGFQRAAKSKNIDSIDMVTIQSRTGLRLYREGDYPPRRGTLLSFDDRNHLLYTRGSVEFYETYTGKYIPHPLEIKLFKYDESPELICQEILALTKMNWNNTQFDRRFPITIECARNVGAILKYLRPEDKVHIKYSFYM